MRYDSPLSNVKYCLQQLMHDDLESACGRMLLAAVAVRDICAVWALEGYYDATVAKREAHRLLMKNVEHSYTTSVSAGGVELIEMPLRYDRKAMSVVGSHSAKFQLHRLALKHSQPLPHYDNKMNPDTRVFHSTVLFNGRKYASSLWEKSKKWSEQMAALVCLKVLGKDFTAVNHHMSLSTSSSSSSSRWSSVSQLTVDCDCSSSASELEHNSTTSHKRLKLSPPTDSPSANHVRADVNLSSAVEIVQQDLSQTVDTDTLVS